MALIKDLTVFGTSRFISDIYGNTTYANKYITNGGTSSQFVKGDGTLDSTQYMTSASVTSSINTALTSYVKKVTSTDNAIARFDGTGGAIQNSSAKVTDDGDVSTRNIIVHGTNTSNDTRYISSSAATNMWINIGSNIPFVVTDSAVRTSTTLTGVTDLGATNAYWNNVYGKKFVTQNGSSAQFVKGDGSLDSTKYLATTTLTQTVVKGVGTPSSSFSNFAPVKYAELKSDADELDPTFLSSFQNNSTPTTYTATNTASATVTTVSTSITGGTTCTAYVKTQ